MKKIYIEYLHPGSFFAENSIAPVERAELPAVLPKRVAGFRFFSRQETELDGEILTGKPREHTPWTYFGEQFTPEQIRLLEGDYGILITNLTNNGYEAAVRTIFGNWYPLGEGETVRALPEGGAA